MRRALAAVLLIGGLVLGAAACGDGDGTEADSTTTTSAETTTTAAPAPSTDSPNVDHAEPIEQATGPEIQAHVAADDPALADLVDWTILSWVSGEGFTATVAAEATDEQVVAICTSIATIVQSRNDVDAVAVQRAGDTEPVVVAAAPDGACVAA